MEKVCLASRKPSLLQNKQPRESTVPHQEAEIVAPFAPAQRAVTRDGQTGIMKQIALLTTELTVDEVMRRWPPTIRAFLDFSMHCVGCPIAPFHTVEEACREHGV